MIISPVVDAALQAVLVALYCVRDDPCPVKTASKRIASLVQSLSQRFTDTRSVVARHCIQRVYDANSDTGWHVRDGQDGVGDVRTPVWPWP